MKQRLLSIVAALSLMVSTAVAQTISFSDFEARPGRNKTVEFSVLGVNEMTALQFNLSLPEGFSLSEDGEGENLNASGVKTGHEMKVVPLENGDYLIVLYNMYLNTFNETLSFSMTLKTSEDSGIKEGRIYNVRMSTVDAVSHICEGVSFKAAVGKPINGITLDQTAATLTEGETLTLTATVSPDDATDKTVTWETSDAAIATVVDGVVTAVAPGEVTITAKAGDKEATCVVTVSKKGPAYVPGDVNNDGLIAIDDVVLTINKVLGITADNFVFAAADMNGDGEILVDDVVLVINAVLGSTTSSVQATRGMACETMTAIGTDYGFSLSTGNAADYVGMQFDMIIPGGISLKDILVSAGSNHTVAVSDRLDGVVRVIVTSMANDAFGLGQLLDVHVSADKDAAVQLTNVYLATRSGALVGLADEEIVVFRTATDIQVMGQPAAANIYDLSGRLVKPAGTPLDGLQKGVYLMKGKKITVR